MYKKIEKFIPLIAAALGVIAIIMFFLPAITIKVGDEVVNYNGWQAIFGFTETKDIPVVGEKKFEYLAFSFMNLLTLILLAAGIVLCVLSFLGKGNKFFAFIAIACFIVAAVFFFLTVAFTTAGAVYTLDGNLAQEKVKEAWKLGAGPIIGGILSILAGLVVSVPVVAKLLKK